MLLSFSVTVVLNLVFLCIQQGTTCLQHSDHGLLNFTTELFIVLLWVLTGLVKYNISNDTNNKSIILKTYNRNRWSSKHFFLKSPKKQIHSDTNKVKHSLIIYYETCNLNYLCDFSLNYQNTNNTLALQLQNQPENSGLLWIFSYVFPSG